MVETDVARPFVFLSLVVGLDVVVIFQMLHVMLLSELIFLTLKIILPFLRLR